MKYKYYPAKVWTQCPYCGHKNMTEFSMMQSKTDHLVTCNMEEGGCERLYAISVSWNANVHVLSLQLEYKHTGSHAYSKTFADNKDELLRSV